MKRNSTVFIAVLSAVTIVFATQSHKKKDETPNERFYRKGGKETKADITVRSGELTTSNIAQQRDLVLYDDGGHINCRVKLTLTSIRNAADYPNYAISFGSTGRLRNAVISEYPLIALTP